MTISTTENRKSYAGNGITTSFAFPYWFPEDEDLVVLLVNDATEVAAIQVLGTHYTVTGASVAAGGTVEMVTKPATGETLVIYRDAGQTQGLDLVEKDEFPVNEVEIALDKLTVLIQRTGELILRSTRMPESETSGLDMVLPSLGTRKNKFGAWDANGNWIAAAGVSANLGPVSAYIDTLLPATDAAAARLTLEAMAGFKYIDVTGTDTYLSVNSPVHTAYVTDIIYFGNFANANTSTTPTWNIDSIGAKTIVNKDGSALGTGQLKGDHLFLYDGTNFRLLNPAAEQGVWTPNLWDASLSSAEEQAYTRQAGTYVKIGNEVFFRGYLDISSIGTLTGSSPASIGPLPFPAINDPDYVGSGDVFRGVGLNITAGVRMAGQILSNNNYLELMLWDQTYGVSAATIAMITGSGEIAFSGHYTAA